MHTLTQIMSVVSSRNGLSEILIGSTLKGSLLLLLCLVILRTWKRSGAATRHFILIAGLAGCLLIPFVSATWIALGVSLLHDVRLLGIASLAGASSMGPSFVSYASWTLPGWWGLALAVWLGGVVLLSIRALGGLIRARLLLRQAHSVDRPMLLRLFGECLRTTGITRPARLLVHGDSPIPFTCGLFKPAIVLTRGALDLPEDEIRRLLLHELAHVKRFDVATNMAAQAAFALFWFNPLVWLALRQLYHEQERACDDRVLAAGEPAEEYAALLLNFARRLQRSVALIPAGITFVRVSSLTRRIQSLLSPENRKRSTGPAVLAAFTIAAMAAVVILSCVRTPTTDKAPKPELAKTDSTPAPSDFAAVDAMPVMTHSEQPHYPEALYEKGIEGEVWVQALVDRTGKVKETRVARTSGHEEFDDAALNAAYKNEFEPAHRNSEPVAIWVSYKVAFERVKK